MPNGDETDKQGFPEVWSLESQTTEAGHRVGFPGSG